MGTSEFMAQVKALAIQLVSGAVFAHLSSWEYTRMGGMTAIGDAIDILASWAHFQRWAPEDRPASEWAALEDAVRQDGHLMCDLAVAGLNPEGWVEAVKNLEALIDNASTNALVLEAQDEALLLFSQLDTADLACWAVIQLRGDEEFPGLAELGGGLCRCNRILAEDLSIFFGVRHYAAGVLSSFRTTFEDDVLGADQALSAGIEKFRLLAEEAEDDENDEDDEGEGERCHCSCGCGHYLDGPGALCQICRDGCCPAGQEEGD